MSILKCYGCRKTSSSEEVEIVTRDEKQYWVCPRYDFETAIVDKTVTGQRRRK